MHYVSIVGPPATGKSSLASELARSFQCDLFRLRQWVHASALIDPRTGDRKAWLDADIVEQALCQFLGSLDAGWHTTREAPVFVTDNFPGTGEQVCQLQQLVSARLGTSGAVYLALKANGQLLARRADERRVCQVCEADRIGDPRLPAEPDGRRSDRCARCDGHLTTRPTDAPLVLAYRLERYHRNAPEIRSRALSIGARFWEVDVTPSRDDIALVCRAHIQGLAS